MSSRLSLMLRAVKELGWQNLSLYAIYQTGLRSGFFRWITTPRINKLPYSYKTLMALPSPETLRQVIGDDGDIAILMKADLLVEKGLFSLFGGAPEKLDLTSVDSTSLQHWTDYETGKGEIRVEDIKFVWEPARLEWAFLLARAYLFSSNACYRDFFWEEFEIFLAHNPAMMGPNWSSGQEVGIRIMVMAWLGSVFLKDDPEAGAHENLLSKSIIQHAWRIPPTLIYARSQHNNHLITEGLGLLCAGCAVPEHPDAEHWRRLGHHWLNHAFESQIAPIGEYAQHSTNYHRLMLQCACLASVLFHKEELSFSDTALQNLKRASAWLAAEVDTTSGQIAVYGHNDGAYLFPFDIGGFSDFRATVQASYRIFHGETSYPAGHWDEFSLWLGEDIDKNKLVKAVFVNPNELLKLGTANSWARMRANYFTSRPAHADQLHVDLWWKGTPVALDAGTYLYNGNPPWTNQLMGTAFHNTIMVDGKNQMMRAGRFLWLDWAQACTMRPDPAIDYIQGEHNGYRKLNVMHRRRLERMDEKHWLVEDTLYQPRYLQTIAQHEFRVHWLLPDCNWSFKSDTHLLLNLQQGQVGLWITTENGLAPTQVQLCRAGNVLCGENGCSPQAGWYSPRYGEKVPVLSFTVVYETSVPITILSKWEFSG